MSEMAVPKELHTATESRPSHIEDDSQDLQISLHSGESYTTTSSESEEEKVYLKDLKNPNLFLTKTAGMMIVYTTFWVAAGLFIIFNMIRSKVLYRSMNLKATVWVFFVFALITKVVASFAHKFVGKFHLILFALDIVLSTLAFFGLYWHFEMVNSDSYQYNGHFVVISGFMFFSTAFGFLFSTLIRLKHTPYSAIAGILMMTIFNIIALSITRATWRVHNVKFYQYFLLWFYFFILDLYIAINAKFILERRKEVYTSKQVLRAFFNFNTDWFSFFWVDLFKSMKGKKKKNKNKNKKKRNKKKSKKSSGSSGSGSDSDD